MKEISSGKFISAESLKDLQSLTNDVHSSIYFLDNFEKVYGESPRVIFTDLSGIHNLNKLQDDISKIELVRVEISKFEELKFTDISRIKQFPKLKYIYFLLDSEKQKHELLSQEILTSSGLVVIYEIKNRS